MRIFLGSVSTVFSGGGLVAKSCPILWDPMDYSPLGFSVHGISQARTLRWGAIASSRGSSWLRDEAHVSCTFCTGRKILCHSATGKSTHTQKNTSIQLSGAQIKLRIIKLSEESQNLQTSSKKLQPREREKDVTRKKKIHFVKSKEEGELIPNLSEVYV